MKFYRRITAIFSIILLSVLTIWFVSDHLPKNTENHDPLHATHVKAMDELLAEDLSITIQLFLQQIKEDLTYWHNKNMNDEKIMSEMKKELKEHEHIRGFTLYKNNKESVTVGEIEKNSLQKLTKMKEDGTFISEPFVSKGKKHLFIGIENEDEHFVAQIDLSFIENFSKDVASLADGNGTFFVGGENIDLSLSENEAETPYAKVEVPDVGWNVYVQSEEEEDIVHYKEGEAVVKLQNAVNDDAWSKDHDLKIIDRINSMVVVKSVHLDTEQLLNKLENDTNVIFAEPNYHFTKQKENLDYQDEKRSFDKGGKNNLPFKRLTIPNDEFYHPYQWNFAQIFTEEGWEISVGEHDVPIAIVDSGIDPEHIDLEEKVIDGYNSFENNKAYNDENGHGTHVAGIAAAITNNRDGVAGLSWNNPILAVKCLDKDAVGSALSISKGIIWAVDNGAKVINLSLGDQHHSELIYDAIKYAYDNDVVIVAASGNDNVDVPMYPAAYDEVLAVAAVDENRSRAFFSNYGSHIDVSAPGEHIPSTYIGNQYVIMSGTSMAAPHVTGLAGLIRSIHPKLTNEEVYDIIRKTSDDLGTKGFDPYYGYGEVNVKNALKEVMTTKMKNEK